MSFSLGKHSGHEGHRRDIILDKQVKLTIVKKAKYKMIEGQGVGTLR